MTVYQYSSKYWFDFENTLIEIQNPYTTVDIQELIDAIRTAEAELHPGIGFAKIADASGKESLGGSVAVGITVNLQNGWQIHFWAGAYTAIVSGGNLVGGPAGDPVAYSAGVQVLLIQSAASTVVATGGSALTSEEHDQLMALPSEDDVADQVWDEQLSEHTDVGSAGEALSDAGGGTTPATIADAVWDEQLSGHTASGSAGEAQARLDATISSRSTLTAQNVWEYATRTLSSFGSLVTDIWGAGTRTLTSFGTLQTDVEDALGLIGENVKWSGMAFDSNDNLISAVITQYTDNTLAVERKKWQLTATYDTESRLTSHELKEY